MAEKTVEPKAWELYHACFNEWDEVIVVDDNDRAHWGRLETHEDFCILHRLEGWKPVKVMWDRVSLMCHQGFPMKSIRANSRIAGALLKMSTEKQAQAMRAVIAGDVCEQCGVIVEHDSLEFGRFYNKVGGDFVGRIRVCAKCKKKFKLKRGDPWLIEPAWMKLFNPGNCGPEHWCEDYEEIIVARSVDGAWANIWDVHTIFAIEVA